MIRRKITIDEMIAYLNELHSIDPDAVQSLIESRVPCNQEMAEHESCQVSGAADDFRVGLLGVLNGAFGVDESGRGPIAANYSDRSGEFLGFINTPAA
jgi:hypothetical protein